MSAFSISNDNVENATTITDGIPISQSTTGATLQSGEPQDFVYACGAGITGSVWFKFTPSTNGIYKLLKAGSNLNFQYKVLEKIGSDYSLVVCGWDDPTGEDTHQETSFLATAGKTYYIAVMQNNAGGSLVLNLTKISCPASSLCLTMTDHSGFPGNEIEVDVLDSDNEIAGVYFGDDLGFVEITDLSGSHNLIISNTKNAVEGDLIIKSAVTIPGLMAVTSKGYAATRITIKDTGGLNTTGWVYIADPDKHWVSKWLGHAANNGDQVTIYAEPGTYSILVWKDSSVYKKSGVTFPANGAQDVSIDASTLPQETIELSEPGSASAELLYCPSSYWCMILDTDVNDKVTFALPNGDAFEVSGVLKMVAPNGLIWTYWLDDYLITKNFEGGGKNTEIQLGGTFDVYPNLIPPNVTLGKQVLTNAGVHDEYDHPIEDIYYYGESSGSSLLIQKDMNTLRVDATPATKNSIHSQVWVKKGKDCPHIPIIQSQF